jgi:hypothetical protein
MCTIMAALGAASSVAQFAGQQQATDAYNAQAAAAHRDAGIAASNKYADEQRRLTYDARANQQKGYEAALKGRAAVASGTASAGSAGVAAGSLTLDQLIAASKQKAAENEARVQTKREDMEESFRGRVKSVESEAQQRINSMPFKSGPNPLGLAINIAGAAAGGMNTSNPGWASSFNFPSFK